jgi:hypothetical protein
VIFGLLIVIISNVIIAPLAYTVGVLFANVGDEVLTPEQITSFFELLNRAFLFFPYDVFLLIVTTGVGWLGIQFTIAIIKFVLMLKTAF